ncbi:MAG TPA: AI-2E family transporter, partial [Candidatus Xenobia bacterium]
LMIVAVFSPPVQRAQRRWGRRTAMGLLGLVYASTLALLGYFIVPSITNQTVAVLEQAPMYATRIQSWLGDHHLHLELTRQVAQFGQLSSQAGSWAPVAKNVFSGFYGMMAVIVLSLYLLIDADALVQGLLRLLPRERRLEVRRLGDKLVDQVGGYIRGQLILSLLMGFSAGLVLTVLDVPAALPLAVLAGVADAIPVFGIWISGAASVLLALAQAPWEAAVVLGFFIVYHLVEVYLLMPRIYRGTLGLSFSIVIVSFIAGIEVMGVLGAILALPLAAMVPTLVTFIQEWHEPSPDPAEALP